MERRTPGWQRKDPMEATAPPQAQTDEPGVPRREVITDPDETQALRTIYEPAILYSLEGPLEEAREIDTPWGKARAEVGCYIATRLDKDEKPTDDVHVAHPDDVEIQFVTRRK
jgi:hypothetical protein